jgi:cytidylate kinase
VIFDLLIAVKRLLLFVFLFFIEAFIFLSNIFNEFNNCFIVIVIDAILDERQKKLWEIEDDFIIDGRLAFHFLPHGVKIFLTVESHEAARRIYHDESRKSVETHFDIEEAARNIEARRKSEDERYMKYYGVHIYDMKLYDIVIDTTHIWPEEVFAQVLTSLSRYL